MEQEYKWDFPEDMDETMLYVSELLADKMLEREKIDMQAVYYDTPDRMFGSMRGALRFRAENGRGVCCMKVERKVDGACSLREEYEVECADVYEGISRLPDGGAPAEVCARLNGAELIELCRTEFVRQACLVRVAEADRECLCELAVDRGHMAREGRQATISEVEFEYKEGDTVLFHSFAVQLEKEFHLKAQPLSKLVRAMNL